MVNLLPPELDPARRAAPAGSVEGGTNRLVPPSKSLSDACDMSWFRFFSDNVRAGEARAPETKLVAEGASLTPSRMTLSVGERPTIVPGLALRAGLPLELPELSDLATFAWRSAAAKEDGGGMNVLGNSDPCSLTEKSEFESMTVRLSDALEKEEPTR